MTVSAGNFVGYDADDIKKVAVVVETSTNTKDDGTEETFALIALLPTTHVPVSSLFPYGTDPTPKPAEVTGSTVDTASGMGTPEAPAEPTFPPPPANV